MNDQTEIFRSSPGYVMTMRIVIAVAMGCLFFSNYVLLRGFTMIGAIPLVACCIAMFNIEHKVVLTADTLTVRRGIYTKVYPLLGTHFRVSTVDGLMSFLFSFRTQTPALYATPFGGGEKRFMLMIPTEEGELLAAALQRRVQAVAQTRT